MRRPHPFFPVYVQYDNGQQEDMQLVLADILDTIHKETYDEKVRGVEKYYSGFTLRVVIYPCCLHQPIASASTRSLAHLIIQRGQENIDFREMRRNQR